MKKDDYAVKEDYGIYEDIYAKLYEDKHEEVELSERLMYINIALDSIHELLEKFLNKFFEGKQKGKSAEAPEPKFTKIGADIGCKHTQMDVIAKIFGNTQ